MKSSAVIGLPSDQDAFGLILYTTVCGEDEVASAESSSSLFMRTVKSGSWMKVVGKIPLTTIWVSTLVPSEEMLLKFGTSFSSAIVTEPPSRTGSFVTLFGFVIGNESSPPPLLPPPPPHADRTSALAMSAATIGRRDRPRSCEPCHGPRCMPVLSHAAAASQRPDARP